MCFYNMLLYIPTLHLKCFMHRLNDDQTRASSNSWFSFSACLSNIYSVAPTIYWFWGLQVKGSLQSMSKVLATAHSKFPFIRLIAGGLFTTSFTCAVFLQILTSHQQTCSLHYSSLCERSGWRCYRCECQRTTEPLLRSSPPPSPHCRCLRTGRVMVLTNGGNFKIVDAAFLAATAEMENSIF